MNYLSTFLFSILLLASITTESIATAKTYCSVFDQKTILEDEVCVRIEVKGNKERYYLNDVKVPFSKLEEKLLKLLITSKERKVVIKADQDVSVGYLVRIASIASKLEATTSISVKP